MNGWQQTRLPDRSGATGSLFVPIGIERITHGVLFLCVGPVLLSNRLAGIDDGVLDKYVFCTAADKRKLVISRFISPVCGRQGDKLYRIRLVTVLSLQNIDAVMILSLGDDFIQPVAVVINLRIGEGFLVVHFPIMQDLLERRFAKVYG